MDVAGDLLPAAVGVALSPVPIVAVILMLGTPRAKVTGSLFAGGWVAGLTLTTLLVLLLSGSPGRADDGGPSTAVGMVELALGLLLVTLAARTWRGRPRPGDDPQLPAWMATIDTMPSSRAAVLGLALSSVNPKNLALTVAAATTIAQAGTSGGRAALAVAGYVALGSVSVAGPTVWYLVAPRRAAGPLGALKDFMAGHNAAIMMVVLLVLGAKLLGNGLAGLAG